MNWRKFILPGLVFVAFLALVFNAVGKHAPITHFSTTGQANLANALSAFSTTDSSQQPGTTVSSGTEEPSSQSQSASAGSAALQYQSVKQDALTAIRLIPGTSTFISLMEQSGVVNSLSIDGTYTFFVPTDAAFAASPVSSFSYLSPEEMQRLAEYHIVIGKKMSITDIKSGYMTTFSGDPLNNSIFYSASVGGNTHIIASYPARNGIIYLTDVVLLPPQKRPFPF